MTPVIRISDEVFLQLQSFATPLVDTPNSVIERLIVQTPRVESGTAVRKSDTAHAKTLVDDDKGNRWNLFLAPASLANTKATIDRSVSREDACERVDSTTCARLNEIIGTRERFHCWAMTESKRDVFDRMKQGDVVLFSPNNTGRFSYRATILGKFESEALATWLWPMTSGLPWDLIYVLDNIQAIDASKSGLNSELGYNRYYRVPGVMRVNPDALRRAISRHGSLDDLLRATEM